MTNHVRRFALEAVLPVALVATWYFASANSTSLYYPPLHDILVSFKDNWLFARVGSDVLPSLGRLAAGYVVACVLGVAGGLLIGLSYIARRLTAPVISFFRSVPSAALLPPAIQIFGIGDSMKVFLIAFVCVWPVLLNTVNGVDEVDRTMLETSRSYQLSIRLRLTKVILPSAGPRIAAGLRVALAFAIVVMIISELTASTNGVGYFVSQAQNTFDITAMWAGIMLLGLIGYLFNLAFTVVEHRALRWYYLSASVGREE
jgi:ABC-type nitrate/sulfonate/bicarbonate transport system permease component